MILLDLLMWHAGWGDHALLAPKKRLQAQFPACMSDWNGSEESSCCTGSAQLMRGLAQIIKGVHSSRSCHGSMCDLTSWDTECATGVAGAAAAISQSIKHPGAAQLVLPVS